MMLFVCMQQSSSDDDDDETLPSDPFYGDPTAQFKHITGIMYNFRPVDILPFTAGSLVGVLQTLAHMMSRSRLGEQALHAGRYILINADVAVANRFFHLIHTSTPWEEDEELQQLLREPHAEAKLAARIARLCERLLDAKQLLEPPRTSRHLVEVMNDTLRADAAHAAEEFKPVTEAALCLLFNDKYYWDGPLLKSVERYLMLTRGEFGDGEDGWDDPHGDVAAAEDEAAAAQSLAPDITLKQLRDLLTNHTALICDTFHIPAHLSKVIYQRYREPLFKFVYQKCFKKGRAMKKRKLGQLRFTYCMLRLAYTREVRHALWDWYSSALCHEPHRSDPRAEALLMLLEFHLPLVALFERALLHGPATMLLMLLPAMFAVRAAYAWSLLVDALLRASGLIMYPAGACHFRTHAGLPSPRRTHLHQERRGAVLHVEAAAMAEPGPV
jgi:hypothetical protein